MKILVLGADTPLGVRIARDAVHRHNAVTVVVQDAATVRSNKYTVLESTDAYDPAAFDAVIDARDTTVTVTRGGAVSTITPPAILDADGRRQGYFRIADGAGESYIGEEDMALAVVDEAEGTEARSFTPVTDRAPALPQDPGGKRRYLHLPDTGIAGQVYHLVMDNYEEYVVHFLADDQLMIARKGEAFTAYPCKCLHCDDGVWMAIFMHELTCVTLVLDEAQSLATAVLASPMPRKPLIAQHRILFGAIRKPDEELPFRRHAFTDELVGNKIAWHYSPYVDLTHCYFSEHYMRSSLHGMQPLPPDAPQAVRDEVEDRARRWGDIFFEEPAQFIRVNAHLYIVCFIESTRNRIDPFAGGGDMVLAVNTRRMRDYGRSYHMGLGQPTFTLLKVCGKWDDVPHPIDTAESPYLM